MLTPSTPTPSLGWCPHSSQTSGKTERDRQTDRQRNRHSERQTRARRKQINNERQRKKAQREDWRENKTHQVGGPLTPTPTPFPMRESWLLWSSAADGPLETPPLAPISQRGTGLGDHCQLPLLRGRTGGRSGEKGTAESGSSPDPHTSHAAGDRALCRGGTCHRCHFRDWHAQGAPGDSRRPGCLVVL